MGGGTRGGRDRAYRSSEKALVNKSYKYTMEHNDMIIGVEPDTLDLYLVPTCVTSNWGMSKSTRGLQALKNNYDILLNWNDAYLTELARDVPNAAVSSDGADQMRLVPGA